MNGVRSMLKVRKRLLPYGYEASYELEASLNPAQLSLFADGCITDLLPAEALRKGKIVDFKGRDRLQSAGPEAPQAFQNGDELFYLEGKVLALEEETSPPADSPFIFALTTHFSGFLGAQHIEHGVELQRQGELPAFVQFANAARAVPIELRCMRLGVNLFRGKYLSSFLGFSPVVTESLLIHAIGSRLHLRIEADSLPTRSTLPLAKGDLLQRLNALLLSIFEFSVIDDYQRRA